MDSELLKKLEEMVNVFTGKVDFPYEEIERQMTKNPQGLVLVIEKKEDGYYSTVYVREKEQK